MDIKYRPTIGLEIHSILKTKTKMFCDSPNNLEEKEPNKNTCPICLGHPGCLPVINRQAVESVLRVGLALSGTPAPTTKFDRKNYFYPDLPKGYQISQYDEPLISGGELCGIRIRRIHLEEDAGRLLHEIPGESKKGEMTYVDYNRAGVPLMELVTEPDILSAEKTLEFGRELQRILRYLGVSDADMEKGQLRLEANLSLSTSATEEEISLGKGVFKDIDGRWWKFGNKVELKNINSFKAVSSAIAYEIERQKDLLESGGVVAQETRGWNDVKQTTFSQRSKEEAHDYRYFPEPDLPPFETSLFDLEEMKRSLPELPEAKRERFKKEYGLQDKQIEILIDDPSLSKYFEESSSELKSLKPEASPISIFNYLTSDLKGLMNELGGNLSDIKITPENLAELVSLLLDKKIISSQAKIVLRKMYETGENAEDIIAEEGLGGASNVEEIERTVGEVISENPAAVADFKAGKEASLQFLIGKSMQKLKGKGNPGELKEILKKVLS